MLMGRVFSYHDSHLHRIGANYEQLPINAPHVAIHSYNKDGPMTFRDAGSQPPYAPNSYGGPVADEEAAGAVMWDVHGGSLGRTATDKHRDDDDFGQAGSLYRNVLDDSERDALATNVIRHAGSGVSYEVQQRVVAYVTAVDSQLGTRVARGLGVDTGNPSYEEATMTISTRSNRA
jgi:catalase